MIEPEFKAKVDLEELLPLRQELKETVERNFPGLWYVVDVCVSVLSILYTDISLPFALILVGPPASHKTTVLSILFQCARVYRSDQFTPASFVSHSASIKRDLLEKIDLLPRIKNKCLVTKELAPVFGADQDQLLKNISIARACRCHHTYF